MQKNRLLFAVAALCINCTGGYLYNLAYQKGLLKQHLYTFTKCSTASKPGHRLIHQSATRSQTLKINNYSLIQLFSLAAGEGRLITGRFLSVKSRHREMLHTKHCYEISISTKDSAYLYKMMMISLYKKFPEYKVVFKNQGKHRVLLITDHKSP